MIVVAPDLLATTWLIAKLRRQKLVADVHEDYLQLLKDRSWAKGLIGFLAGFIAHSPTTANAVLPVNQLWMQLTPEPTM